LAVAENDFGMCAIVCDGCGSSKLAEVGAQMVSRFLANEAVRLLSEESRGMVFRDGLFEALRKNALYFIKSTADMIGGQFSAVIADYFLFTVVGALITEEKTWIFTLGDGCFSINENVTVIDQNNRPRYLSYALVPNQHMKEDPCALDFVINEELSTSDLVSLVIATDGAIEIEEKKDLELSVLGKTQHVQGLSQFETNDKYINNRSMLQKRLVVLGINHRILRDDTTLILIKLKPEVNNESKS